MLSGVIKGRSSRPRRVLLYGQHGEGKSTWASKAPSPIVLQTEDGLDDIGVDRTPLLKKTTDVARWLIELAGEEEHGYKTVVIDTLDWLEKIIHQATCEEKGKRSIEEFGYGRGYVLALRRWEQLLHMLDGCRDRGLNIVLLAHAKVERFSPPEADAYDRWMPDLHKTVSPMIQEWCDEILFATRNINTIKREEDFGRSRTRPIGGDERLVWTTDKPTHVAKRRIELPDKLPLEWSEYQKHWPNGQASGNISGAVVDGSSKKGSMR
jgi:hypothetical protein